MSTFNHISVNAADDDEEVFVVGVKSPATQVAEETANEQAGAENSDHQADLSDTVPAPEDSSKQKPSTEQGRTLKTSTGSDYADEYGLNDVEPISPLHKLFIIAAVVGVILIAAYIVFFQH